MATRNSGYDRIGGDTYVTPRWVWDALYSIDGRFKTACDPAPVERGDYDFLSDNMPQRGIATNPPFSLSDEFVRHALDRTRPWSGIVAMLLPHNWDTANGRRALFGPPFRAKYALTRRIRWDNLEQKKNGPSTNHAWYVWDWNFSGPPTMGWLP